MSLASPFAIVVLALVGAVAIWALEQLVAGRRIAVSAGWAELRATASGPLRRPASYDRALFHGAPALLLLSGVAALAVVPWAPGFRGIDLQAGALFFGAALAYVTPAVFMAGWGSGRPSAVLGGFRWIALMLAYAMPLAMVVTAVAAPAGSLRPVAIVAAQHAVPMAIAQPLAFALWLPAVTAVCLLPPFDLPQAAGELGGGAFADYRGIDRIVVGLARRVLLLAVSGMTVALFLAGWQGPVLPPLAWMILKTGLVAAGILWAGRRLPRVQIDWALSFAWKVVNPLAILAIVIAGAMTLVFYR